MSKRLTQKRHQSDVIILPSEHRGHPAERGALKRRLTAWRSSTPHPKCTSLGTTPTRVRCGKKGPIRIEEHAALLTHLPASKHAVGVLSMPRRAMATDVVAGAVEFIDHGDI